MKTKDSSAASSSPSSEASSAVPSTSSLFAAETLRRRRVGRMFLAFTGESTAATFSRRRSSSVLGASASAAAAAAFFALLRFFLLRRFLEAVMFMFLTSSRGLATSSLLACSTSIFSLRFGILEFGGRLADRCGPRKAESSKTSRREGGPGRRPAGGGWSTKKSQRRRLVRFDTHQWSMEGDKPPAGFKCCLSVRRGRLSIRYLFSRLHVRPWGGGPGPSRPEPPVCIPKSDG